jgi:rhodanese-related sulfurtransferase
MAALLDDLSRHPVLDAARSAAEREGLPYAGRVPPAQAWALVQAGAAVLVDVRTAEERQFVGQVPGSVHVAWATGLQLRPNPRFVGELREKVAEDEVLLLLCRSGKRSALAAEAATQAGYPHAYAVTEGFEGELNETGQRGVRDGWRFRGLPWAQG